jgi:predicted deacylase
MDDEQWITQIVEKDVARKQQAQNVLRETGAIRREWKCADCGAVLQWDSDYARYKHRNSRKHTSRKAELKL